MTEPDFELPHDVLLGGEFARQLGPHGDEAVQITAPAPLDGGSAVFTPLQMGVVAGLEPLLVLLRQGVYSVFPLESTGPLEKGAGQTCLIEAFKSRGLHPLDDTAELATRLLAQQPIATRTRQEVNQTLRVAGVLNRVPVVELAAFEHQGRQLLLRIHEFREQLDVGPIALLGFVQAVRGGQGPGQSVVGDAIERIDLKRPAQIAHGFSRLRLRDEVT